MAGTDIVYRRMELDDVSQVQLVEERCFASPWSKNLFISEITRNENAIYVVAVAGERIVGYAGIWIILDEGHITNIAVDPDFRRLGIGERLMGEITMCAIARGVTDITLEVRVSNKEAQALYTKFGFVPHGIRKEYYLDNKEDALIMWRELGEKWTNVGD